MTENHIKQCSKCGVAKPISEFYRTSGATCKDCQRNQVNALRTVRASQPVPASTDHNSMKRCSYCQEVKSISAFGIAKHQPDGRNHRCKMCRNRLKAEKLRRAQSIGKQKAP